MQAKISSQTYQTLRRLADNSFDSIIITDMDEKIIYVNKEFTQLTGYTAE